MQQLCMLMFSCEHKSVNLNIHTSQIPCFYLQRHKYSQHKFIYFFFHELTSERGRGVHQHYAAGQCLFALSHVNVRFCLVLLILFLASA